MTSDISTLSDRLTFFLAVNTGFVVNGIPDGEFLDFYQSRSSPKLHCVIVGNVIVPDGFGSNSSTAALSNHPIWTDVARVIRIAGSKPGIQLATAWEGYVGSKKFVAAEPHAFIAQARDMVQAMGSDSITKVLSSFDLAGEIATQHGFGHIQIHAAHGYLLSLLVDQRINPHAVDAIEKLALLSERLKQNGLDTSIRISLRAGDPEFDDSGTDAFQDAIAALPFDFVDLSSGFYNIDKRLIYPARQDILKARLQESLSVVLRHPKRSFIISGRAFEHDWTKFPPNMHIGLCRDLIANPKFLDDPHDGCKNESKCHYYSRGTSRLTCGRWKKN